MQTIQDVQSSPVSRKNNCLLFLPNSIWTTRGCCRPPFPSPLVSSVIHVTVCLKPEAWTCRQARYLMSLWWESQQEVRSGSLQGLGSELSNNFPHKSSRPPLLLRGFLSSDSAPPSDRLNPESSAIVVRDSSLSLLFDSRLSNYVLDVETRCHYHCLVGPGKCFLDHQQSVAHHVSPSLPN